MTLFQPVLMLMSDEKQNNFQTLFLTLPIGPGYKPSIIVKVNVTSKTALPTCFMRSLAKLFWLRSKFGRRKKRSVGNFSEAITIVLTSLKI